MSTPLAAWELDRGEEIVPGLIAMKLLGGGEAYEAYLAFDETLYAPVVAKVVRPDQVESSSTRRGLLREIEMLGRLNHPAIVRSFRADPDGERPYIVLENIDGPRLSSLIRRHGQLPIQQLLPLGLELASAVHYLGENGICHLDIKPSNIIMGAPARLIDLSVARTVDRARELTYSIGTDDYMAPEQCDPPHSGTPGLEADMWGVGATMFEAASGYRAFDDGSRDDDATAEERYPQLVDHPYTLPAYVPHEAAKLILSCLHPSPDARPTPLEFAESLEPMIDAMPKARLAGFKLTG